jgi:hypothetical protein
MKRNGPGRAFKAFETGDAILLAVTLRIIRRDRSQRTILYTLLTPGAVIGDGAPEDTKTGGDRKEGSKRAEVTAPESFSDDPQGKDGDEDSEDEKVDFEERQGKGRKNVRIPRKKALDPWDQTIEDEDGRGVNGDDQCSGDQADGIEQVEQLPGHRSRSQGEEEDPIAKPSERLVVESLWPLLFPEEKAVEEIEGGAHGAKPSAKEIAEDDDEKEDPKGRKHLFDNPLARKQGNHSDEGVKAKVKVDRDLHVERKGRMDDEVNQETEKESLGDPSQRQDRFRHVAVTFFILTFERSIWPSPMS